MKFKSIRFKLLSLDIQQPRNRQIKSIISSYKQTSKGKGDSRPTIIEFEDFYEAHSGLPEDIDESFVVAFERSPVGIEDTWIHLFISTRRLLQMSLKAECIHADGTYKTNIQNMGDATPAIRQGFQKVFVECATVMMCYFHVKKCHQLQIF